MSGERREPTFGGGNQEVAPKPHQAHERPASAPVPVASSGGSGLAWFGLLVGVAACAGAGYLYWAGQQQAVIAAAELQSAEDRIAKLEQRLDFSNEESSQSVESLRAKVKWADTEIRKLWGIAYDRNRKSIDSHKKQLSSLSKKLKATSAEATKTAKLAAAQASNISSVKSSAESSKAVAEQAQKQLLSQEKQLKNLLGDVQLQATQVDQLRNGLLERVKQNEESIDSITVYRRTTNREILSLQKRLAKLQGVSTTP